MSRLALGARAVVQAWVRCYTAATPPAHRTARRAELAADLHDHVADLAARGLDGRRAALEILRRLLGGIPDDLAWALRPEPSEETMRNRTPLLALTGWASALVLGLLNLMGAVAGLQDGWREIGQHWWSVLAAAGVLVAVAGLGGTLATRRGPAARAHDR